MPRQMKPSCVSISVIVLLWYIKVFSTKMKPFAWTYMCPMTYRQYLTGATQYVAQMQIPAHRQIWQCVLAWLPSQVMSPFHLIDSCWLRRVIWMMTCTNRRFYQMEWSALTVPNWQVSTKVVSCITFKARFYIKILVFGNSIFLYYFNYRSSSVVPVFTQLIETWYDVIEIKFWFQMWLSHFNRIFVSIKIFLMNCWLYFLSYSPPNIFLEIYVTE